MSGKRVVKILVYAEGDEGLRFLKRYFRKRRGMRPTFANTPEELIQELERSSHDVMIIDSPNGTEEIRKKASDLPTIALISGDIPKGLRSVVKHNIDYYLLSPFHEDDLEVKIKTALNRRSWFEKLYSEKRDLEAIIELTYLISSTLDPKEVLYFIVKKLSEMIDVSRCSMISLGFGEKRYAHVVSSFEDPNIPDIKLDLNKYPEIKKAMTSKSAVVIRDAMHDPLMKPVRSTIASLGIQSIVVIPVIYRDEVIGTLSLRTSKTKPGFTDREIKLCKAIANASANALYNAFLFERLKSEKARLEKLAITDYLTGVYNIRFFYHRLEEEFSRAERYGYPVSCIMLDIDHFKRINDTYGHTKGDMTLREFAQLIRRHTRKSDVFARYGGEEFIILLPQTSLDGAKKEAERLMKHVKSHRFKGIEKERITTSMGISCWPVHKINTAKDIIALADNALYEAKAKGRDRIEISGRLRKKTYR